MWLIIQESNPIWYFDSTGSILVNVPDQQHSPFLYSLVCHDVKNKAIIPVCEFILTNHDADTISTYLFFLKRKIMREITFKNKFPIAPIIVTDFSWSLINSVLSVFNNFTVSQYLNWSFNILFEKKETLLLGNCVCVRICLCAAHFLKLMIFKVKQLKATDRAKKTFIYCFTLLQNSISIIEFEKYLVNTYNIFNQKKLTVSCLKSIAKLRQDIENRDIKNIFENEKEKKAEFSSEKNNLHFKNENIFIATETAQNIKNNSPFLKYFAELFINYKNIVDKHNENNPNLTATNEFYCPELFELIVDQIYIMPLWTGLILAKWHVQFPTYDLLTRVTNNPVENYFGKIKTCVLRNKVARPSHLTSMMYSRLLAKYLELYNNAETNLTKSSSEKLISDYREQWYPKKKQKKTSFSYYNSISDFGFIDESVDTKIKQLTKPDFEETAFKGLFF
jgi:hypothetical protein